MTNSSDTICAVGTPKKVQLSCRKVSRTKRTRPYQTKKSRIRSPGRSRFRAWNPSQIRKSAPSSPDSDSYRNSGWKSVVSNGNVVARVGGDPMGAVDRDPPRQRRRRAVQLLVEEVAPAGDGLHHEQPRRHDVGPAQERDTLAARVQERRDRPQRDPAVDAETRVRRQEDLDRVVLVERPLVDDVVQRDRRSARRSPRRSSRWPGSRRPRRPGAPAGP